MALLSHWLSTPIFDADQACQYLWGFTAKANTQMGLNRESTNVMCDFSAFTFRVCFVFFFATFIRAAQSQSIRVPPSTKSHRKSSILLHLRWSCKYFAVINLLPISAVTTGASTRPRIRDQFDVWSPNPQNRYNSNYVVSTVRKMFSTD